jgi:putative hydrolase of HD superfamily
MQRAYFALWMEYEEGRSPEARLVAELDKLEMAAQALTYEHDARATPRDFDGFWASAGRAVESPQIRERLRALERERGRSRTRRKR